MLHALSDIFHSQYPRCFWPGRWMALIHCTFNFPCCRIVFIPPRCHKLWRFSSSCQKGVKEQFSPAEFHAGKDDFIVTIPNCTSARVLHDLIALGHSLRGQNLSDYLCQICELHHYRLQTICSPHSGRTSLERAWGESERLRLTDWTVAMVFWKL